MSGRSFSISVRSRASTSQTANTPVRERAFVDLTDEQGERDRSSSPTLSPSPGLAARLRRVRANNGKGGARLYQPNENSTASPTSSTPSPLKRKRSLEDDNEDVIESIERPSLSTRLTFETTRFGAATPITNLVDDSDTNKESDDDEEPVNAAFVRRRRRLMMIPRVSLAPSAARVRSIKHRNLIVRTSDCVEFKDGTFMKVKSINGGKKVLVGPMFVRLGKFGPQMPSQREGMVWKIDEKSNEFDTRLRLYYKGHRVLNEVLQKIRTVVGEDNNDYGLWKKPVSEVIRIRELHLTNQDYSETNCIMEGQFTGSVADVKKHGALYSRWQDISFHAQDGKWAAQSLQRYTAKDTEKEWTSTDEELQSGWRGSALYAYEDTPYTYIDSFCGAGGMSSGAEQAGFKVHIAFDKDANKILTHSSNFPECNSIAIGVAEFIDLATRRKWRCDVLHLSPPCQPFSSANTRPNIQKNEINSTPLLACADVIKALKPRIVTVEEAPGIVNRHHAWFYALLHQFTELGFSIRWSELKTFDFGVPQLRRRFILIASAPGEVLPPFPQPTHERGSVTIRTVIEDLRAIHRMSPLEHHEKKIFPAGKRKPSYNPDSLAKTITCGASENYHPSGRRAFTIRELASLQTFPFGHKFTNVMYDGDGEATKPVTLGELRQQIGNAVPPNLGRAVLSEVLRSLRESDAARLQRLQHGRGVNDQNGGDGQLGGHQVIQLD